VIKVVVRWRARGTHSGSFRNVKPSKRNIDVTGITIYRFSRDKIVESWGEFNAASLAKQCAQLGPEVIELLGHPAGRG